MSVSTISAQTLAERVHDDPELDLIDVRTPAEFGELHVAFARNVPLDRLNPQELRAARNGKSKPLHVICQSGKRSRAACEKLVAAGLENVVTIDGGTKACAEAGLPVNRGRAAMSLERQVRIAAGALVLTGVLLGWLAHPLLYGLAAFVGAGLVFAGIADLCLMGNLLARMPWNQAKGK